MNFTGAGIISVNRYRYGYYETRAKLNTGPGWHSSFWSIWTNADGTNSDCKQTEIDGFEIDSKSPRLIRNNVYDWVDHDIAHVQATTTRGSTVRPAGTRMDMTLKSPE